MISSVFIGQTRVKRERKSRSLGIQISDMLYKEDILKGFQKPNDMVHQSGELFQISKSLFI